MKLFAAALGARFAASHADLREASETISDAMQIVGLDRWPRFLADLHKRASDPVVVASAQTALPGAIAGHPEHGTGMPGQSPVTQQSQAELNATDLARLMVTEAGGTGRIREVAMTAVGWTVRNRMVRNGRSDVSDVWTAYRHGKDATQDALRIARGILDGSIPDPTNGATHFYTPDTMPKNGDETKGKDVAGGLESVPDVKRGGQPIENYKPGFAATMERKPLPSVPDITFKFFGAKGNGYVR